jgi:hypothetical protein
MNSVKQHARSFRSAALGARLVLFVLLLALPLGLSACGGGSSGDAGIPANAHIANANNYTITSSLTISRLTVKAGGDLHICWSGLTTDLLKHTIDPAKLIDHVSFLRIKGVAEADVEKQFAVGTFNDQKVEAYFDFIVQAADRTSMCVNLSQFQLGGKAIDLANDFYVDANRTYVMMWASGLTPGAGSKTMLFLEPDASSTVVDVNAPPGKDILTFSADLTTPPKVDIPAAGPYLVEWTGLTKDGMGIDVKPQNIDGIIVGHYDMTVAELQAQALDYELIASPLYRAKIPIGNQSIDLTAAASDAGAPFAGFSPATGTWAIGLTCSKCQVPAPVAVVVLNPQ